MKTIHQVNDALCRALGIADTRYLTKAVLTLEAGRPPGLVLHRLLVGDEGLAATDRLATLVEHLEWKPAQTSELPAEGLAP